jgi:1,4-alpha-glucan branching enzyme
MGLNGLIIQTIKMQLYSFIRKGNKVKDDVFVVCNFTQVIRENYRIGIPRKGSFKEILIVMQKYMEEQRILLN